MLIEEHKKLRVIGLLDFLGKYMGQELYIPIKIGSH